MTASALCNCTWRHRPTAADAEAANCMVTPTSQRCRIGVRRDTASYDDIAVLPASSEWYSYSAVLTTIRRCSDNGDDLFVSGRSDIADVAGNDVNRRPWRR